jgi:DNA-binding SARP family transcriptional activator/WD40 repeat protein
MESRLLGVLEVREQGVPVPLGGPKQRSVLAMLLLDPNRVVSTERLVEGLWDGDAPLRAAATLQVYVSNLRKALEPGRAPRAESSLLRHQPPGYVLAVDPSQIDLFRFEQLVATARQLATAGCVAGAASLLREGLGLWREAPLADLVDEPFARYEIPRLDEAHWAAIEDRIEADLALGRHGELVAELEALVARHPYRERLRCQYMLALYRAGRQADALGAYQAARAVLLEALGLEPSRELRELEAAVLVQDPSLGLVEPAPLTAGEVDMVLVTVAGTSSPELVARVTEAGQRSARRGADELDRAVDELRTARFAADVAQAGAARALLVRARSVVADQVLEHRRRVPVPAREPRSDALGGEAGRDLCPYRGLLPFELEDAAWYFGREQLAAELLATVATTPCTAVVGASGSGKSSLVRAGLLASVRNGALPGSAGWPSMVFVPGADPLLELARALAPLCHATSANHVRNRLFDEPESIAGFAGRALERRAPDAALVVVVDQFEELFTVCSDAAVRDRFLDVLVEGACTADARVRIATAVRADYFSHCAGHTEFGALVANSSILVGHMSSADLQRAIEIPAAHAGLAVEVGLVDRILDDAGTEPGSLPLVETALLETWRNREGRTMTIAGYERTGGVTGALAYMADEVYAHFSPDQQAIVRGLFLRLAETGMGQDDVRRRAPLSELLNDADQADVLGTLVERRLVVTGDTTAEVAHEAILRAWPRLRTWLEENREGRRVQRALSVAARDWTDSDHDPALLFRGSRLAAAVELEGARPVDLNPLERDFLRASRAAEQIELDDARRTSTRLRHLTAGLAVLLALAIGAGIFSIVQRSHAEDNATRVARQARASDAARLADTARGLAGSDADLASLLAVEALHLAPSSQTEGALEGVLAGAPVGLERVIRFDPEVRYATASPDGSVMLAPGVDGVVRVVSIESGKTIRVLDGPSPGVIAPLFFRDGSRIVAGSVDGKIRLWDAQSGRQVVSAFGTAGDGPAYGFGDPLDRDGVYVAEYDGQIVRWSVADPHHPHREELFRISDADAQDKTLPALLFVSPDGTKLLVSRASTGFSLIWDLAGHQLIGTVAGTAGGFDPQGRVITHDGGQVLTWDATSGVEVSSLTTGIADTVGIPVESDDGRFVAVVEANTNHVLVLDTKTGVPVVPPIVLHNSTPLMRFLPDGRLLTMSNERAAVFRISGMQLPAFATGLPVPPPSGAFFTQDGGEVVTFGRTSPIERWSESTGKRLGQPTGQPTAGQQEVLAPNGRIRMILDSAASQPRVEGPTGERLGVIPIDITNARTNVWWNTDSKHVVLVVDGVATLWDLADPAAPRKVDDLKVDGAVDAEPFLTSVASSHDGKLTAVLRERAGVVSIFDTATGRRRSVIRLARGTAPAAAFSPDTKTLAVTNATYGDGPSGVDFYDVTTGKLKARLGLAYNPLGSIAYVRGGTALLLVEVLRNNGPADPGEANLQLWDTRTLRPIGEPFHLNAIPTGLSPSPDGSRVVHGTTGDNVVVWKLDVPSWRRTACQIASRRLSRAEWSRYLPGRPYNPVCH